MGIWASLQAVVVSNAVPDLMEKVTESLQQQGTSGKQAGRMILSTKPRSAGVVDGLQQLGFL